MVKRTSIVGSIAVQDLTKAGDIIRSRTGDTCFPLVMVAVLIDNVDRDETGGSRPLFDLRRLDPSMLAAV